MHLRVSYTARHRSYRQHDPTLALFEIALQGTRSILSLMTSE
jgi:hypothetical protein